jgi:hypothetical protein
LAVGLFPPFYEAAGPRHAAATLRSPSKPERPPPFLCTKHSDLWYSTLPRVGAHTNYIIGHTGHPVNPGPVPRLPLQDPRSPTPPPRKKGIPPPWHPRPAVRQGKASTGIPARPMARCSPRHSPLLPERHPASPSHPGIPGTSMIGIAQDLLRPGQPPTSPRGALAHGSAGGRTPRRCAEGQSATGRPARSQARPAGPARPWLLKKVQMQGGARHCGMRTCLPASRQVAECGMGGRYAAAPPLPQRRQREIVRARQRPTHCRPVGSGGCCWAFLPARGGFQQPAPAGWARTRVPQAAQKGPDARRRGKAGYPPKVGRRRTPRTPQRAPERANAAGGPFSAAC